MVVPRSLFGIKREDNEKVYYDWPHIVTHTKKGNKVMILNILISMKDPIKIQRIRT